MLNYEFEEQRKMVKDLGKTVESMEELRKELTFTDVEVKEINELGEKEEQVREALSEIEKYSSTIEINNRERYIAMLKKEFDKKELSDSQLARIQKNITMLENLFTLSRLEKTHYSKYNKQRCEQVKAMVRKKLSINRKFGFIDPRNIERPLKAVMGKKEADRFIFHVNNFILNSKLEVEGTYIHFLLLALATVNNDEMKDREILIESLKKFY